MLSKITSWRHSKVLAFVLAVAVFLTAFYGLTPVISRAEATGDATPEATTVSIWNGTKSTFEQAFAEQINEENIGTEANPYRIYNGAQLWAATRYTDVAYHFKLMNDIQLQSNENLEKLEQFINGEIDTLPAGLNNWSKENWVFKGVFDGDFHKIIGLYNSSSLYYTGFMNRAKNATIKNVIIDREYLTGPKVMGGVVGWMDAGNTIDGCSVINSKLINTCPVPAEGKTTDGQEAVGGIVGTAYYSSGTGTIKNCSVVNTELVQTNVQSNRLGGIWGDTWGNNTNTMAISNCFVDNYLIFTANAIFVSNYTNVYTTVTGSTQAADSTTVTVLESVGKMKGVTAYDNMPGITPAHGWVVLEENGYPVYVGAENVANYDYLIPVWSGQTNFTVAKLAGAGTNDNPYLVSTGGELYAAVRTTTSGLVFEVINDIKLQSDASLAHLLDVNQGKIELDTSKTLNTWATGNKNFQSTFKGNRHTIFGLYMNKTSTSTAYNGLFGQLGAGAYVEGVRVNNLYIKDAATSGNVLGGGIAAYAQGAGISIVDCVVQNATINCRADVGAIVGASMSSTTCLIDKCVESDNNLTGGNVGAVVGSGWSSSAKFTITNTISATSKPVMKSSSGTVEKYENVYTVYTGTHEPGADGSSPVNISAKYLKGGEIPGFDASTGWEIKDGEYPEYTGNIGTHPSGTKVYWNGYTTTFDNAFAAQIALGKGDSAENPYEIYYAYQLYAAVTSTSAVHFKLMNDIQLQSGTNMAVIDALIAAEDPSTVDASALNSWERTSTTFAGTFDGNFHTVSGLYFYRTNSDSHNSGFITQSSNATVKNLTLDKMYIDSKSRVGGIIGYAAGTTTIDGCAITNSHLRNTRGNSNEGYNSIAGFVAQAPSGTHNFNNCVVLNTKIHQTTPSSGTKAGIYGDTWGALVNITNCITEGIAPYTDTNTFVSYSNVYTTVSGSTNAADGSKVTVAEAKFLKGIELPGINASTGWEIKTGEWPKYTGVIGTRPENTKTYWNGLKYTNLDGLDGEGTIDSPKKIYNGYELYAAVNSETDTYFKLMNDIQLQSDANMLELAKLIDNDDSTNPSEGTTFNDWGKHKVVFKGHIDGNFKTVSGLYINNNVVEGNYGLGFISRAAGPASIDNLTLDQMYVTGKVQIGGFVGIMYGSDDKLTISGCVLKNSKLHNTCLAEEVPSAPTDAQYYGVAGIIAGGWNGTQSIKNTAVYDNTFISDRGNYAYGLVGPNNGRSLTATNCIVEGYIPRDSSQAYNNVCTTASVTNSGAVVVTKEQLKSGDELPGIRPLTGWELTEGEYPVYTGVQGTETTNGVTHWNGAKTDTLDVFEGSGSGTEADPYIIRHGFELYAAVQNTDSTKHFKLVNDIYLNDVNLAPSKWTNPWAVWLAGKTFSGTLDGNGYTVYGVHEPSSGTYDTFNSKVGVGFIPKADNAVIKNLHLRNVYMYNCYNGYYGNPGAGGLIGVAGTVTIEGCSVGSHNITHNHTGHAGGFIGQVTDAATIKDSAFVGGTVKAKTGYYYGSIIGDAGTATVTLTDVVANGYAFLGNGTATETNTFLVNVAGVGYSPAGVKYVLRSGQKSLSDAFYYDFLSENFPQLKNRKATQNVDIDGNAGTELDADDALALKNILLYGGANQVNATDKTNYYNEVEGLDIADLVYVYVNAQ